MSGDARSAGSVFTTARRTEFLRRLLEPRRHNMADASSAILFERPPRRFAHRLSQLDRLDELDIGAMRQCELHYFFLTVESKSNADAITFVRLLDHAPTPVPYPT